MQLFRPSANTIARVSLVVLFTLPVALILLAYALFSSSYFTREQEARAQPVPFSHQHHVAGLGLDCRYCHTTVEQTAFAGIPPTHTCMGCHSQIWLESAMLEPVRESYRTETPLVWTRVNDLPDFVYFDHSIHVAKGVGCSTCHGPVDQMPLTWKAESLRMGWCLECHRNPAKFVRPKDQVFNMGWVPPPDQLAKGQKLVEAYAIQAQEHCYACHR